MPAQLAIVFDATVPAPPPTKELSSPGRGEPVIPAGPAQESVRGMAETGTAPATGASYAPAPPLVIAVDRFVAPGPHCPFGCVEICHDPTLALCQRPPETWKESERRLVERVRIQERAESEEALAQFEAEDAAREPVPAERAAYDAMVSAVPAAPPPAERFGNRVPPVVGLPAEDQRLIDALGGLVGHEYPITISLDVIRRIVATIQRSIRDHFAEKCGKERAGPDPLDRLEGDLAGVLSTLPPPEPSQPVARGPNRRGSVASRRRPVSADASAELEAPEVIADRMLEGAHATGVAMEGLQGVLRPEGSQDPEWVVFIVPEPVDLEALPVPAMVRAVGRYAAENQVATVVKVRAMRCFALPAYAALREGSVSLAEHPLRKVDPAAVDRFDAFHVAMQRQIEKSNEDMAETMGATARLLGKTVPQFEAELAERAAEEARALAEKKAARPPKPPRARARKAPEGGAHPADLGMRRLSDRQRELLGLLDVDEKSGRVVYTRDEHVPDWAVMKQAVEALGGVYMSAGKKTKGGWVFAEGVDPLDAIRHAILTGGVFDPRLLGFFPTSAELADALVARLALQPGDQVLEPSGGKGALALAVRRACPEAQVVCVELLPENQAALRAEGFQVVAGDFLSMSAADLGGPFDVVIANPPFGPGRPELHHTKHMFRMLKGAWSRLGIILPASIRERQDPLTTEVRGMLEAHTATFTTNGPDAFRHAGTGVRTFSISLAL